VQVAVPEQEIDAVSFRRDGIVRGRRDYLGSGHGQLIAADAPVIGANRPGDGQRGFLAEALELLEKLVRDLALFHNALAKPRPVPNDKKLHLPAGARLIKPSGEGDLPVSVVLEL